LQCDSGSGFVNLRVFSCASFIAESFRLIDLSVDRPHMMTGENGQELSCHGLRPSSLAGLRAMTSIPDDSTDTPILLRVRLG